MKFLYNSVHVKKLQMVYFDAQKGCTSEQLTILISQALKKGVIYLFLDEIQVVDNWESVLREFEISAPNAQFIVSGSRASAFLLSTKLTGRHMDVHMTPYSFYEFCNAFKDLPNLYNKWELFDLYLTWGGFPQVIRFLKQGETDRCRQYLSDIFKDIVTRDVKPLLNGSVMFNSQVASEVLLGNDTHHLAPVLESVDLIRICSKDNSNYCIDNGLYNEIIRMYDSINHHTTNIRQVVFWHLTKLGLGHIQENNDGLLYVNGTRYYCVVENRVDICRGFELFLQVYIDQMKDPNKVYTLSMIGPYGSLFVNNILNLDGINKKSLINVWDIINYYCQNLTQTSRKTTKQTKRINKTSKVDFRDFIGKLLLQEYEYFQIYFYFKTLVHRYIRDPVILRFIWKFIPPLTFTKLNVPENCILRKYF